MRFDTQKAFPYPVLRPDVNDYVDGEFQVSIDVIRASESPELSFHVHAALSVDEVLAEIASGRAALSVVFSCRDTYFRDVVLSNDLAFTRTFDASAFRGEVTVAPHVVALEPIRRFHCPDINAEFGQGPFNFEVGEVLAVDEPKVIYIEREMFRPVSSVMQLVKHEGLSGFDWRVSFDDSKIQIQLSPEAKEQVDRARNSLPNRAVLINSLYFSALMEALHLLRTEEDAYAGYRWAQVITHQCHNVGLDYRHHEAYAVAQRLLRSPLVLLSEYCFKDED